jgi:DNA-directed RNA polymerase subunit omega
LATAKRARQLIAEEKIAEAKRAKQETVVKGNGPKPLSIAVQELYEGKVKIVGDEEEE